MAAINPPPFTQNGGNISAQIQRMSQSVVCKPFSPSATNASVRLDGEGGVWPQYNGLQVIAQPTPNMTVNIQRGLAVLPGTESITQGNYPGAANDSIIVQGIATANATLPRIDSIVWQVRDNTYSGATNLGQPVVYQGTPASSPAAPNLSAVSQNYVLLANITVRAGTTQILSTDITDMRHWLTAPGGIQIAQTFENGNTANIAGEWRDNAATTSLQRYNGSAYVDQLLAGQQGFSRYYANSGVDGINYSSGNTFRQTYNVGQRTCSDVVASGTGNYTFTFKRAGRWRFRASTRFLVAVAEATGSLDFYMYALINGTTETGGKTIKTVWGNANTTYVEFIEDIRPFNVNDYIEFWVRNNSAQSGSSLASGEDINCSFNWEGP